MTRIRRRLSENRHTSRGISQILSPVSDRVVSAAAASFLIILYLHQSVALAKPAAPDSVIVNDIQQIRGDLAPQIESVLDQYSVPGLSLVVVQGNEILWAEGFGYADKSARRVATQDTVYRAGSLAKPFTAMAVMQLAQSRTLNIDKPLKSYLPEMSIRSRFETKVKPPTVRDVMTHHSGLPADLNKGKWTSEHFTSVAPRLSEEYLAFPPKLVFSYSNLGYTLLGHMIQKLSGTPYEEYMEKRIFDRWGMQHSGMRFRSDMPALMSKGYRKGRESALLPIRDLPAHGLYTSASDLGKFLQVMLSPETKGGSSVLSTKALQSMYEPQNLDVPLDLSVLIGLGWFLEHDTIPGAQRVVRHSGTTLTFNSELILLPEDGLGVAVLSNGQESRPVVSRLAEEILTRLLKGGANLHKVSKPLHKKVARDIAAAQAAELEGSYATDFGLIAIRPEDEELCACLVDQTFDVIPYPDGWFGISKGSASSLPSSFGALGEMRFKTQRIDGREVIVARKGSKRTVLGEKIPLTPVPEAWVKRVGKYKVINPDSGFPFTEPHLRLRDGQLCMSYKMPMLSNDMIQVPLRPISDTEAIILGLGRTRGETLRVISVDGEERLRYSGFVGRKR